MVSEVGVSERKRLKNKVRGRAYYGSYGAYLRSEDWQVRRKMKMAEVGYRCQLCNCESETLYVHHRTYERVGNEHPADLTVLCGSCHSNFHRSGEVKYDQKTHTWKE